MSRSLGLPSVQRLTNKLGFLVDRRVKPGHDGKQNPRSLANAMRAKEELSISLR
jgi:hypothetical protein